MKMKLALISLSSIVILSAIPIFSFSAAPATDQSEPPKIYTDLFNQERLKNGPNDIIAVIERIANWIFVILLLVAVIFILLAAFAFLRSGGEPEKVNEARKDLIYAAVAIAVGVLAKGLVFNVIAPLVK